MNKIFPIKRHSLGLYCFPFAIVCLFCVRVFISLVHFETKEQYVKIILGKICSDIPENDWCYMTKVRPPGNLWNKWNKLNISTSIYIIRDSDEENCIEFYFKYLVGKHLKIFVLNNSQTANPQFTGWHYCQCLIKNNLQLNLRFKFNNNNNNNVIFNYLNKGLTIIGQRGSLKDIEKKV